MKTFFDAKNNIWNFSALNKLPSHDLYYGTPWNKPSAGIPYGDGDTGSLIWLEKDGIHINIGKSDLWQDAPRGVRPGEDWFNTNNEELHTLNKHGGEIVIRLDCPLFDYMYQEKFCQRLSLKDATVFSDNSTPFGKMHLKAFASDSERVSVIKLNLTAYEGTAPEITLKRWGSRTLWRWYWQQRFAPEVGLDGTDIFVSDNSILVTQDVTTTKFCLGLRLVTDSTADRSEKRNSHEGRISLKKATEHSISLYYAIRIAETTEKAKKECEKALEAAISKGCDSIYSEHTKVWEDFWKKSYISLADDYIENHIYLFLYYMNSASRGSHPMHFIQGPWGFYHDFVPWNYYFHYNMQHLYAPLDTLSHGELAQNYYDMRIRGLETAKLYAKMVKGKKGAFYNDVTDRYCRGADYALENHTPGSQIAMQMYYHYKYTGDTEFLEKYALPVMKETALYYIDMLEKGDDGLYHTHDTCGYEGTLLMDDTLSDLVMIKALLPAYLPYADNELKQQIEDILSHLPDFTYTGMYLNDDWDGERLLFGYKKGEKPLENGLVYTIGKNKDGTLQRRHCGSDRELIPEGYCVFPYVEFSPLYPAGILGLKDKGTKPFNIMLNQLGLTEVPLNGGMHWHTMAINFARMGKGNEMYEIIRGMLDQFQAYPNGFNAEQGEPACKPPFEVRQWYRPYNTNTNEVFMLSPEDFTHFDFETTPVITKAVTESLLQSHEGILRICPATPDNHEVSFSLAAEGGFTVNAEIKETEFVITIEKKREKRLLVSIPERFANSEIFAYAGKKGSDFSEISIKKTAFFNETAYDFSDILTGETVLISSVKINELESVIQQTSPENRQMKQCGKAHLGTPELMHN